MNARKTASAKTRGPATRPLAAGDLDAVVAIDSALIGRARRAYHERRLAAAKRTPELHAQFAVEEGGRLTGYVLGKVLEGEFGRTAPALRLEVIAVSPDAQGHGDGLALCAALEAEARRRGIGELRTGASWRDHRMLQFLDHAGWSLGSNHVIDCRVADARLGSSAEAPAVVEARERPADQNDYGASAANDFEALARDLADVRSLSAQDLDAVVRIDRRLTGHDRSAYMKHRLEEALADSGIRVSLVARIDDGVAGYLMASADYGDFGRAEPVAIIDTVGVDPGYAHRGVGHALLSQLFINLAALRIERVETVLARENLDLLEFFYHAGFGPSERLAFVKPLD
ncbi:MAG: GNAT family N-acetyltransferase [Burkholderiales bacterium]|nr:GNAT family N-acetyltransferase [Burkholderiales bacterium]